MKKIPTIYNRNPLRRSLVLDEINPDANWVFQDRESWVATRKYDGACCAIMADGAFVKRREVKPGKPAPKNFIEIEVDSVTGKRVGWVPVDEHSPDDQYFVVAFDHLTFPEPGTYELVGPKVQGNPEKFVDNYLIPHRNLVPYREVPLDILNLTKWFADKDIEGLVFHHADGRMAKIKKKDLGLKRKPEGGD